MKKADLLFLLLPLLMVACKPKPVILNPSAAAKADESNYPYKIKHPDYWDINTDHKNTMAALQLYKVYETGDTTAMSNFFADSIKMYYDGGKFIGTTAAMLKMFAPEIKKMKNHYLKVEDWESVISTDKKEEWVTTWYTEHWTNPKGIADSIQGVDDFQFKNGKIITLYTYSRHFSPVKGE